MNHSLRAALVAISACALVHCGPGSMTGDGGSDAGSPLGFIPSNIASMSFSGDLGDIALNDCGEQIRDDHVACAYPQAPMEAQGRYTVQTVRQSDGSEVIVFLARSWTFQSGRISPVLTTKPVVFVALDTITVDGSIVLTPGMGGGRTIDAMDRGQGPGAGANGTFSGGGAGHCGIGGNGATSSGGRGGVAYGAATLSPLTAGSSGGGPLGGSGGGALQLVARNGIVVSASGSVQAGGEGARGGGGSGGALLFEAPSVQIAGQIGASGAGGGAGVGPEEGADGAFAAMPTAGGAGDESGGAGGAGGGGSVANGTDGTAARDYADGNFGGKGGGAAGRIRINTTSGAATVTGSVSLSGACFTQGSLAR